MFQPFILRSSFPVTFFLGFVVVQDDGCTAFLLAADFADSATMEVLLEAGADKDAKDEVRLSFALLCKRRTTVKVANLTFLTLTHAPSVDFFRSILSQSLKFYCRYLQGSSVMISCCLRCLFLLRIAQAARSYGAHKGRCGWQHW